MSLESATWATQLSSSDPASSDPRSQGDDHLRLIKAVIKQETAANSKGWVYTGDTVTRVSGTILTTTGDQTAVYPEGRRVKIIGSSTGTIYGRVSSSTYSTNTAINLHFDLTGSSMSNETLFPYVGPQWQALSSAAEVSFTPTLQFGGASTGVTYSQQTGQYIRVGNLIWFRVVMVVTSKGSSNGTATIGGIPFASLLTCYMNMFTSGITFTVQPGIQLAGSTATIIDGSNLTLTDTAFAASTSLAFSGVVPAN